MKILLKTLRGISLCLFLSSCASVSDPVQNERYQNLVWYLSTNQTGASLTGLSSERILAKYGNPRSIQQLDQRRSEWYYYASSGGFLQLDFEDNVVIGGNLTPLNSVEKINFGTSAWLSNFNEKYDKEKSERLSLEMQRRSKAVDEHPEWKDNLQFIDILAGKIKVGMNQEMVLASWGRPYDINKTVSSAMVSEQWVYEETDYSKAKYAYFNNGVLTSYQE